MKRHSIWLENMKFVVEPTLKNDITCDVLIVGGGITGISTAYHLRNLGQNVVVVDKNQIAHGVTARTTGKLTFLQETIYSDLAKKKSKEISKQYLDSQLEAIQLVKQTIEKHHIDCDLKKVDSYVFSNRKEEIKKIKKEKDLLEEFGIPITEGEKKDTYFIKAKDTYVFHPLKYVLTLKEICKKEGVQFFEHTNIYGYSKRNDEYEVRTDLFYIHTKKIVFACHYPYFLIPYLMPLKCTIEKSYIAASKVEEIENYSAITSSKPVKSIRFYQNQERAYRICLSGSHNLYEDDNITKHFEELKEWNSKLGGDLKFMWSNHDIMTFDGLPFVGYLEKQNEDLYLATGYNTWGMTNGSFAGKMIADMILKKQNPYIELLTPLRRFMGSTLPKSIYGGIKPMIEEKLWKNKKWYPDNVYFEVRNGKSIAIYVDNFGKEHIVYNTCPHLKCSLLFNPVEKTWDCPCHGSRFDIDGNVLIGPSNYNIHYYK